MKATELLKHFDTPSEMARAFGVERQSVSSWIKDDQIPEVRQYQAEMIVRGKLKADFPADRRKIKKTS